MKYKISFIAILIVAVLAIFVLRSNEPSKPSVSPGIPNAATRTQIDAQQEARNTGLGDNMQVIYDDSGFQPKQITVTKGSTVNFTNKTQLPMWVASAPHPEHTNYPELDAGVIEGDHIAPGNPSFSFKFDKPGTWIYHNHSVPEHEAVITVK